MGESLPGITNRAVKTVSSKTWQRGSTKLLVLLKRKVRIFVTSK